MGNAILSNLKFVSGDPTNKGYRHVEAKQFVEFCVELDSQDDRQTSPNNMNFLPQFDPTLWNPIPVYDSRQAVAADVVRVKSGGATDKDRGWSKLYADIIKRAEKNPPKGWSINDVQQDPRYNGFGPYQMAWLLYEGRGENAGSFAIAIRGTVFSAAPSAVEDFIFQPVSAKEFLNANVSFAEVAEADLHSGFAHGTFSLVMDDRYGIVRVLNDFAQKRDGKPQIQPNARLFIVGHSQGAAMATLVHAFLHYAMKNATASANIFGLFEKHYKLKSYVFAQPKPGSDVFASDFASYTQYLDNAIVINNHIDPVPQVPLTLQDLGDIASDIPGRSWLMKTLQKVAGMNAGVHRLMGKMFEPLVRKNAEGYGYYYGYPALGVVGKEKPGGSWNFMPAGHVLLVYGTPANPSDKFLQHHAWTYRNLIAAQLPK